MAVIRFLRDSISAVWEIVSASHQRRRLSSFRAAGVASDSAALARDDREQTGTTILRHSNTLEALPDNGAAALARSLMLVGGEALTGEVALCAARGRARGINIYGPTETTIWSRHDSDDDDGA